jgi:sigma-E factor negative regulatory protein RseB
VGRAAHVVEALRDGGGIAGRFWLDAATGLVLRRESFDKAGRLVRSSAFTAVTISPTETPEAADVPVPGLDRTEVSRLRAAGWQVPEHLPGDLELFDARLRTHGGQQVLHLSYSDGLSTLSLFAQHGRLGTAPLHGFSREQMGGSTVWVRPSSPERIVWGGGGRVFTLLSDASPDTVRSAVRSLPHDKPPRTGLLARLERGLKRLGSWLNPFD